MKSKSNNWASGAYAQRSLASPDGGTQFERLVVRLGLEGMPEMWSSSKPLRLFAEGHRTRRYIPEELLAQWGLDVCWDDEV